MCIRDRDNVVTESGHSLILKPDMRKLQLVHNYASVPVVSYCNETRKLTMQYRQETGATFMDKNFDDHLHTHPSWANTYREEAARMIELANRCDDNVGEWVTYEFTRDKKIQELAAYEAKIKKEKEQLQAARRRQNPVTVPAADLPSNLDPLSEQDLLSGDIRKIDRPPHHYDTVPRTASRKAEDEGAATLTRPPPFDTPTQQTSNEQVIVHPVPAARRNLNNPFVGPRSTVPATEIEMTDHSLISLANENAE